MPEFEFHISRKARKKYQFDEALFALNGNVVLADFAASRHFAESMTRVRGETVPASDINAMGLIDEILHILVRQYERQNPGAMRRAFEHVRKDADATLLKFTEEFPPLAVHRGEIDALHYLDMETAGRPNRQSTLEEMLLLYLANANPALAPYRELFDDEELRRTTAYETVITGLQNLFCDRTGFQIRRRDSLRCAARTGPACAALAPGPVGIPARTLGSGPGRKLCHPDPAQHRLCQGRGHPAHGPGRFRRGGARV